MNNFLKIQNMYPVLIKILNNIDYISLEELVKSDINDNIVFLAKQYIYNTKFNFDIVYREMNFIPDLYEINLKRYLYERKIWITSYSINTLKPLQRLKDVKELSLVSCKNIKNLNDIFTITPNLETIQIDDSNINDLTPLTFLPKFKKLYLWRCDNINIEEIDKLSNIVEIKVWRCKNLPRSYFSNLY